MGEGGAVGDMILQALSSNALWATLISVAGNIALWRRYTKAMDRVAEERIAREKEAAAQSERRYEQNERFVTAIQALSSKIDGLSLAPRRSR